MFKSIPRPLNFSKDALRLMCQQSGLWMRTRKEVSRLTSTPPILMGVATVYVGDSINAPEFDLGKYRFLIDFREDCREKNLEMTPNNLANYLGDDIITAEELIELSFTIDENELF